MREGTGGGGRDERGGTGGGEGKESGEERRELTVGVLEAVRLLRDIVLLREPMSRLNVARGAEEFLVCLDMMSNHQTRT